MQGGFEGAIDGFCGKEGEGISECSVSEAEQLASAFACHAEFEAGVAQGNLVLGEKSGWLLQAVVQLDGIGEAGGEKQGEPIAQGERRRLAIANGLHIGGDSREKGAIIGIEFFELGKGLAQVAQGGELVCEQKGNDAGGQSASVQRFLPKGVGIGEWRLGGSHRLGEVEEARRASYSSAVSRCFSRASSRKVLPEARDSFTSCATRS